RRGRAKDADANDGLDRAANLLGALSLAVADRAADAVAAAAGRAEAAPAALSALLHFLDRPAVDLLRQVLGLTSSGTVRLLDRLTEAGYGPRGPGADGRGPASAAPHAGGQPGAGGREARGRGGDAGQGAGARAGTFGALAGRAGHVRPSRRPASRRHDARPGRDPVDLPALRHWRLPRRRGRLPGWKRGAREVLHVTRA